MQDPMLQKAIEQLAQALKQTEDYRQYQELRDVVHSDEASLALLRRFQSAQTALQLAALSGQEPKPEDTAAFEGLSGLLYANSDTADYLLAKMRLEQLVAQVMQQLTSTAGLEMGLPEL